MIIGTAGHVDHGKSALVEALTGRRMDRLVEERRRGITIDLNFAPLDLGDGLVAGIVDVPGHEDLVRTMVAGATGIDLLLLVVAADEGVMPQTREHLAIAEALGVPRGLPVLSKADLVEPAWLELVRQDVIERLAQSSISFEEPLVASPPSGAGIAAIRDRLRALHGSGRPRHSDDLFRMPVDRCFSKAGVGTVVTGSCWSGSAAIGGEVVILPGDHRARIRSIERHSQAISATTPGDRVALGLAGVDRAVVGRGSTIVSDPSWTTSRVIDAEIHLLPDAPRPLAHRTRVRFLMGTAEVMARVHTASAIPPGGRAVARLACEEEVVARGGDRLVVRSYSPVTTIGGGEILDPAPPRRSRAPTPELASADHAIRLRRLVGRRGDGVPEEQLAVLTGLPPSTASGVAHGTPDLIAIARRWTLAESLDQAADRALAAVARHHRERPGESGAPLEAIRQVASPRPWLAQAALDRLGGGGDVIVRNGVVSLPDHVPAVAGGDAAVERLVGRIAGAGLQPPSLAELTREFPGLDVVGAVRIAVGQGRVVAVERDRHYSTAALEQWVAVLRELGATGEITVAGLRERLGLTRKFLIPLLEWSDRRGETTRVGDVRRLRSRAGTGST